jgi:hypothetical protein
MLSITVFQALGVAGLALALSGCAVPANNRAPVAGPFGDVAYGEVVPVAVPGLHGVYGAGRMSSEQVVLLAPGRPSTFTVQVRRREASAAVLRVLVGGERRLEITASDLPGEEAMGFTVALPVGEGDGITRVRVLLDGVAPEAAYEVVEAQVVLGAVAPTLQPGSMR